VMLEVTTFRIERCGQELRGTGIPSRSCREPFYGLQYHLRRLSPYASPSYAILDLYSTLSRVI
jgi:hypothetical protein